MRRQARVMSNATIRVSSTADLIATLPLQLGYEPEDSLVLVLLGPPEQQPDSTVMSAGILAKVRIDLPHDVGSYEQVIGEVTRFLRQQRPAMAYLFSYEGEDDSGEVLRCVARLCAMADVEVCVVARIRDGRWQSLSEEGGVASEWEEIRALDRVPCAADFVFAGCHVGLSREELNTAIRCGAERSKAAVQAEVDECLDRLLAAVPDGEGEDVDRVADQVRARMLERAARAWRRILDDTPGGPAVSDLAPAVLAQALVMLSYREFRDALIMWIAPGVMGPGLLPREVADVMVRNLPVARLDHLAHLDRLVALSSLVPDEVAPAALTVTAQSAWALGNGTIANIAVDRALELDPAYYLAQLTDSMLRHGVRPPRGPFAAGCV